MTVGELIEELKKHDSDALVIGYDIQDGKYLIERVEKIEYLRVRERGEDSDIRKSKCKSSEINTHSTVEKVLYDAVLLRDKWEGKNIKGRRK